MAKANRDSRTRYLKLIQAKRKRNASKKLASFTTYTKDDYDIQWFHDIVCTYLDKLSNREIKKLMIFMPPQHGKTELSSRRLPAFLLGKNPKEKLILGSYNSTKASEFVTDCLRIMQGNEYKEAFPKTELTGKLTAQYFEVNKGDGYLKGAGMSSGVTGTTATGIIIDDPFKGRNESNSETIRDNVWKTYSDDFQTRLSNDSFQLMLFTRWHEDDLAGRILDPENPHYDEQEASEWTVIAFSALKESESAIDCSVDFEDPRELDEALWEDRHSREKYVKRRRINPTGFASLDQQRPSALEGNKILREWFEIKKENELPFNADNITTDFFIDGAFTDKTKNDETGLLSSYYNKADGKLYIFNCIGVRKELYKLLPFFKEYTQSNHGGRRSRVNIELKASGHPLKSMLSKTSHGAFNCIGIPNKQVSLGKFNRVESIEPFLASGKVVLIKGGWNQRFIDQCATFPNGSNDDMVDVLAYSVMSSFMGTRSKGLKRTN